MKTLAKENNGGGLSFECYDDDDNIVSVVTGLEFAQIGQGVEDIKTYGAEWDWTDVGGDLAGYGQDGNTDNSEYTADDMVDDSEYTSTVAEWDGVTLTLKTEDMGNAARKYFGVKRDEESVEFEWITCPHCGEEFEKIDFGHVQCPHCDGICGPANEA